MQSSNHKMAITMLASMYNSLKEQYTQESIDTFTEQDAKIFTDIEVI